MIAFSGCRSRYRLLIASLAEGINKLVAILLVNPYLLVLIRKSQLYFALMQIQQNNQSHFYDWLGLLS
jgi:hypothetical protein